MPKTLFLLILLVCTTTIGVFAQKAKTKKEKKPRKDFILNNSGDTIWGQITGPMTSATASVRISFIDDKTNAKTVYKAGDIKSWHPGGQDFYFESKEYRPKGLPKDEQGFSVFMKRLTPYDGTVKIYEYYNTDGQEGYTQTFLQRGGKIIEVNFEKFYAEMAEYFSDYLDLSNKIKQKKYKKSDLIKIVDEYNIWKNRNA